MLSWITPTDDGRIRQGSVSRWAYVSSRRRLFGNVVSNTVRFLCSRRLSFERESLLLSPGTISWQSLSLKNSPSRPPPPPACLSSAGTKILPIVMALSGTLRVWPTPAEAPPWGRSIVVPLNMALSDLKPRLLFSRDTAPTPYLFTP